MSMLLAFLPFLVFAGLERVAPLVAALAAAALVAGFTTLRDYRRDGTLKALEIGTLVLFGGLAIVAALGGNSLSIPIVRLVVDAGLVIIAAVSLAIGRPFTLAYSAGQEPTEPQALPIYRRTHAIITAVWMAAFVVLVIADAMMEWLPAVPLRADIGLIVLAFVGAVKFTRWYPDQVRKKYALPPQSPSISSRF